MSGVALGRILWSASLAALAAGCSESEYAPVRGQVFYRGRPLTAGVIMFQPPNGPPARADIEPDGSFELTTPGREEGARIGVNKVRVASRAAAVGSDSELALGRSLIPERYGQFESSGLAAEVKVEGNEPFVFQLRD